MPEAAGSASVADLDAEIERMGHRIGRRLADMREAYRPPWTSSDFEAACLRIEQRIDRSARVIRAELESVGEGGDWHNAPVPSPGTPPGSGTEEGGDVDEPSKRHEAGRFLHLAWLGVPGFSGPGR
jgi:hypothetical protein